MLTRVSMGVALERRPAGDQFIQHYTQGVDIHPVIKIFFDLLWRHVFGGTYPAPAAVRVAPSPSLSSLTMPKSVSMGSPDSAKRMLEGLTSREFFPCCEVVQGARDRQQEMDRFWIPHRAAKAVFEGAAGQVRHHQVRFVVLFSKINNLHDVGVIQSRHGFRFSDEAFRNPPICGLEG
jgi:hypothetical protein